MDRGFAFGLWWVVACASAPCGEDVSEALPDASDAPSVQLAAPVRASGVELAPRTRARPVFVDVAREVGIDHVQATTLTYGSCATSVHCEAERMTGGVAVGDIDGDGIADLVASRMDGPIGIYLGGADGRFETRALDVPGLQSNGLGLGDVDDDGDLDLYVTTFGDGAPPNDRNYLFINDGSGTFADEALERGAAIASTAPRAGTSVAFGDFDRDGHLDLYATEWAPFLPGAVSAHARLLRNLGGGLFEDVTVAQGLHTDPCTRSDALCGVHGFAAAFTDLDGDGWLDLAVAGDFGTSHLLWNDAGVFREGTRPARVGTEEHGMGSTVGDFDGDGDLDWFVTSIHDPERRCASAGCYWGFTGNRLYRNDGDRRFTDVTDEVGVREGSWGWGAAFFDYDNDGDLDLVSAAGVDYAGSTVEELFEDAPTFLWENVGGRMIEVAALVGLDDRRMGKGLAVFDYEADGDLDVVLANNMDRLALYRNDGGNRNAWLRVRVLEASGRDAHGARVVAIESSGRRQLREIGTTTHMLGQSEAVAHFGLGPSPGPVTVEVRFPDGRVRRLEDVAPRQTLVVRD